MAEQKQEQRQIEGEGSHTAAAEYNERTQAFVQQDDVEARAKEARDALDGDEGDALRRAEDAGKAKLREEDPQVHRE